MLRSIWRFISPMLLGMLVVACGGKDSNSAPPGSSSMGISVSPKSLSFVADQGGVAPASQELMVTMQTNDAYYLIAGYPAEVPTWLYPSNPSYSGSHFYFTISADSNSMAAGIYHATLRIGFAKSDYTIIGYEDVAVSLTIHPTLSATPGSLAFSYVLGAPVPPSQALDVYCRGLNWTATTPYNWVTLSHSTGSSHSNLSIGVDPANLDPGTYYSRVDLSDPTYLDQTSVNIELIVTDPNQLFSQPQATPMTSGKDAQGTNPASAEKPILSDWRFDPATIRVRIKPGS